MVRAGALSAQVNPIPGQSVIFPHREVSSEETQPSEWPCGENIPATAYGHSRIMDAVSSTRRASIPSLV